MKQPIFVDNLHEYDYTYEDRVHTLFYSEEEQWAGHVAGKKLIEIRDTGNGLKIKSLEKKNELNYHEAVYLDVLLRIINKDYKFEIGTKTEL